MFSLGNNIKAKLALAAVVVAGAAIVPSSASAVVASGCAAGATTDCKFVGGPGHNAATDTGGATQFRVNSSPNATVTCADSRATAVTNGTMDVAVTLQFNNCTALGLAATVLCTPSNVTLVSGGAGSATGTLRLSQNNCTITIGSLCTIRTSNTVGGQAITVGATGATGAKTSQITAAVAGNTSALTFNSTGGGCILGGVPASGTATFSNDPNSGAITYDEVPSTSSGGLIIT
jgi:hypothetical protein